MTSGESFRASELVRVRPNVRFEPLVEGLYAWLHLVAPATAARNLQRLHVPLWRSFLEAPEVHRASARDPRLRGGMFVDLPDHHAAALAAALARLDDSGHPTAELADGLDDVHRLLAEADGCDLSPLYRKLPAALKGRVELTYDLANQPRPRLIEGALYRCEFDTRSSQTFELSLADGDDRPFAMTTPRFGGPGRVTVAAALADRRLDEIFAAADQPRPFGELAELVDDDVGLPPLVSDTDGRSPDRNHAGPGVRVRYFGHATVVIESADTCVVVDPFIADFPGPDRFTFADLPDRIDLCLITHGHQDHLELGSLLRLRHRIGRLVVPRTSSGALQDPSLLLCARALGFPDVVDAEPYDEIALPDGTVLCCPFLSEHCDLDIGAKLTYAVRLGGRSVYLGADNRGVDPVLFRDIRSAAGPFDLVFLGMECDGAPLLWLYGPLFTDRPPAKMARSRKLNGSNASEALASAQALGCDRVLVYAMGREPWLKFVMATDVHEGSHQMQEIRRFQAAAEDHGIQVDDLFGRGAWLLNDEGVS